MALMRFIAPLLVLSACTAPGVPSTIAAKINYVCAYSGLFKFVDTTAAAVIPIAEIPVQLINAGVDQACEHPDTVAQDVSSVTSLINTFKTAGKM